MADAELAALEVVEEAINVLDVATMEEGMTA